MKPLPAPIQYLTQLKPGMTTLWCYLIWYLVTVAAHFDPSPRIWLSSLGISAIVGIALLLTIRGESAAVLGRWQTFRLFLMPFSVSSFSSPHQGTGLFSGAAVPACGVVSFSGALCGVCVAGACSAGFAASAVAMTIWP